MDITTPPLPQVCVQKKQIFKPDNLTQSCGKVSFCLHVASFQVSAEVLRVAEHRHRRGLMYPQIFHILTKVNSLPHLRGSQVTLSGYKKW